MRPSVIHDPRSRVAQRGWVARLGAGAIARYRFLRGLVATLTGALGSALWPGVAAREVVKRVVLLQILFTGVQALGLVSVVALFIGATIIIQTGIMAPATTGEMLGQILVAVVVRELAPLGTAIVIAGRSGTAIATELGNMKVNSEVLALSSLGIDPLRYVVLPRLVGAVVSVLVLIVYFSVVAILGGYLVSLLIIAPSFDALRSGFAQALSPADLALFLIKGVGLGTMVGWLSSHYGLEVMGSPTEVPQKASRAVVMSLLGCVVFNTAVTAVFYAAVGSNPVRY